GALLGYLEEVHSARGVNVDQVRALADVDRLLVGSRHWTVWTDLDTLVAAPEFTQAPDSVQHLEAADGSRWLGVGSEVPGTAWMVWVERSELQVLAPVERFLRRMWTATLLIALTGAVLAWLLARIFSARIKNVAQELDRTLAAHSAASGAAERDSPAPSASDELLQLEQAYAALESRLDQRRRLDEQLLQAQKLEAVGRLAGGIAHDFNNLLTVMASYAGMAREALEPESPQAQDLDEVIKAVERATALTRQLLAFSRQRISDTRPLDLNEVVRSTDSMLARLIPSNVERVFDLAPHLPFIEADHTQLEQVLINLVVNAVDAMPEGGRVTLRTSEARASGLGGADAAGADDHCVCLSVTDTGVGMDAETMARIFDPFFTTKAIGKGTGLGLATVHGIVEALGGRVVAYSEPGQGTTMRIYLPVAHAKSRDGTQARVPLAVTAEPIAPGLVLLAEDDVSTRTVIRRILESVGHRVEAHETADACLAWLRTRGPDAMPIVVISDVMMPGLNGIAFTKVLREEYPQLPVILVSGYADVQDRVPEMLAARPVILEKPFTASALHDAMRRALRPSGSGAQA
ncbi:MAG TPA: ATP-binding protein, partial [Gemmatimonadaceae bacterium]|nr:ATP-binding protein [Gemmatimonadaceae bacterium]